MRVCVVALGIVAVVSLGVIGCNKDKAAPMGAPSATPSAAAPARAQGTDGGGDGSGSSIPNARGLTKAAPATFSVPCSGGMYVGPFTFTKDPEELAIHATAKTPSGEQICVGGQWVDSTGKFLEVAGFGCPEAKHVAESDVKFVYSPGNGGHGAKPVYLVAKFDDAKPAGCKTAEITLSLK